MSNNELWKRLTDVFRDVFDDSKLKIDEHTTAGDIEDWDSLEHINLIDAIEHEFRMKFKMREVSGMKNAGEMADIIAARGK